MTGPVIHRVSARDAGARLDRWFKRNVPGIPHALLQKLLRKGAVKVDGKKAKADQRLSEGQEIRLPELETLAAPRPRKAPAATEQDAKEYLLDNIIHRDAHIIAINKPPGLPAQGGSKVRVSVDAMLDYLKSGNDERPRIVHRIDKDTSGVMLLARTLEAASALGKAFRGRDVKKIYWAVIVGVPPAPEGRIDLPLSAHKPSGGTEKTAVDEENGKPAVTSYRVMDKAVDRLALVELIPETGRMHQLRAHMAAIGHPILGDGKYGGRKAFIQGLGDKMHLHAHRIIVPAGVIPGGKKLDLRAKLPPHMRETWDMLGFPETD